jgi:hypothetical protein
MPRPGTLSQTRSWLRKRTRRARARAIGRAADECGPDRSTACRIGPAKDARPALCCNRGRGVARRDMHGVLASVPHLAHDARDGQIVSGAEARRVVASAPIPHVAGQSRGADRAGRTGGRVRNRPVRGDRVRIVAGPRRREARAAAAGACARKRSGLGASRACAGTKSSAGGAHVHVSVDGRARLAIATAEREERTDDSELRRPP